jgi:arylsulfatase
MGGAHGLKSKGNFMYEQNLHVPFIVIHPAYEGGRRIGAVTSHLDIAPTLLDMTNLPNNEKERLTKGLMGHSLMPLLDGRAESIRDGALHAQSQIATLDAYDPYAKAGGPDFTKRGLLRGIVTGRYKFARYFSPLGFNLPTTLDELYINNDVELYDLETDPDELHNLAADRQANAELIYEMNRQLNELIAREIGADDGGEMDVALKFFNVKR